MAYTPNTWVAREGTDLNRFVDQDGNYMTLTQAPTEVTVPGTPFSATWMNHIEQGVAAVSNGDYIVETGTSEGWKYAKWNSGKLECEISGSESVSFSASGSLFIGNITLLLPAIFVTCTSKSIQAESNIYFIYGGGYFTGTSSVTFNIFRAASGDRTCTYLAKVTGTWK